MSNFLKYLFDNFPHTLCWNFNRAGFESAFTEQGIKKVKGFVFAVNPMACFNITADFGAFEVLKCMPILVTKGDQTDTEVRG